MQHQNVTVIGAGTMGNGIAHVFAQSGRDVTLVDVKSELLDRARTTIEGNLARQVKKGTLTDADAKATVGRIRFATAMADGSRATLAVEAVTEVLAVKQDIFRKLDALLEPRAILATNTSSISITKIASATGRADR